MLRVSPVETEVEVPNTNHLEFRPTARRVFTSIFVTYVM